MLWGSCVPWLGWSIQHQAWGYGSAGVTTAGKESQLHSHRMKQHASSLSTGQLLGL